MAASAERIHPNLAGHKVLVVESDWILNPIKSELDRQGIVVDPRPEEGFNFYDLSLVVEKGKHEAVVVHIPEGWGTTFIKMEVGKVHELTPRVILVEGASVSSVVQAMYEGFRKKGYSIVEKTLSGVNMKDISGKLSELFEKHKA
jgi:hypothetical protein